MKVLMTLSGTKNISTVLDNMGKTMIERHRQQLIDGGVEFSKLAKQKLEEASQARTGKKYWTGALQEAIVMDPVQINGLTTGVTVKIDNRKLRKTRSSKKGLVASQPYGEWVDLGHGNWPGYYFMENAFIEIAETLPKNMKTNLALELDNFGIRGSGKQMRFINTNTGRFVSGAKAFTILD
jgi:hypothetical protein